ncbi:DUF6065 family protein [Roseomonas sp. CCTCC AB2023176]|uniref:DUF6065 family protein n=1 Tax=Roseomonas sp. CCTCC AB2023176 TaxID=3342640 RepID=UPI0035E2F1DB
MSDDAPIPLVAHTLGGPGPDLRPASARREWMDATPGGFAKRCLPLTIANAHGWDVVGACAFEAWWTGGDQPGDVVIRIEKPGRPEPVAHFGAGVLTFHVEALFRTPPGIGLWVSGPPNAPKDGIAPLTGMVETDWSPATFTMNWRFTRPRHPVRFAAGEPIAFLFPIRRDLIPRTEPALRPLSEDPVLEAAHRAWADSRAAFNAGLKQPDSEARARGWQRDYTRGHVAGVEAGEAHLTRLQPRPFAKG